MPGVSVISVRSSFFPASDSLQSRERWIAKQDASTIKGQSSWISGPSGFFMSDSEGKNPDSTVAIFFRGSRALGWKHHALLDFRGRDRWLIHGNQSIDVTVFFRQDSTSQEVT